MVKVPKFQCQKTIVLNSHVNYTPASFLGIPQEVRDLIWQFISDDIYESPHSAWYSRPKTGYEGLNLVCRQTYHETSKFWRRSIIPHNRLSNFFNQPYSQTGLLQFRFVSLEIPFNTESRIFQQIATMLHCLNPHLSDLRIFFMGKDGNGIRNLAYGCASRHWPKGVSTDAICINDEDFSSRKPLIQTIGQLTNLQALVLHDLNISLLQSLLINHKPKLKKLCVVMDPRTLYQGLNQASNLGLVTTTYRGVPPPIEKLQISANAALTSCQIASKVAPTLKELTWIMPDMSKQPGDLHLPWYRESGTMLRNLRMHAKKLHTLRICIEGVFYEENTPHRHFVQDFQQGVPYILGLKNLELHACLESPWMGEELLQSLPPSLERLHISDGVLNMEKFLKFMEGLCRKVQSPFEGRLDWLNPGKQNRINLGFVGYDYQPHKNPAKAEFQKLAILKYNATLLDRELNNHLEFEGCQEFQQNSQHQVLYSDEYNNGSHVDVDNPVQDLTRSTYDEVLADMDELNLCKSSATDIDSETEKLAEEYFYREAVAMACDLQDRTFPIELESGFDDHWTYE